MLANGFLLTLLARSAKFKTVANGFGFLQLSCDLLASILYAMITGGTFAKHVGTYLIRTI
jgi:hypothetical protein